MNHVMFDIDGTLIESYDFDSECFAEAVKAVTGYEIDTNWSRYTHVTDTGILNQFFQEKNIENTQSAHEHIKRVFLSKIHTRIAKTPVSEIVGAAAFIARLKELDNVSISLATGGWYESALLKLVSAGMDISDIPIASANDHYSRIEIMKIAEKRAVKEARLSFTYFGDGSWDLNACNALGVNFVLVGDRVKHSQSIMNFEKQDEVLAYIGL
ncbi:HAD family hydrolase [Pseudoalteromonas ardens]|uniref:Haloacid dehalogenase n=1 Tax=Pseudoalteromonas rubra TaxID=43658 RepID=A0A0L0EPA8_9GAMM|nr:HAD hydrolase-like protein [Pseudoalteromonas sp. R96]KNC66317.1 haloacid dehalogenase [Pseudoalteromonas rubra]MDK1312803.1 HAD hydrolase-like protein [Pseudoalteromonas sp. R96]